jgi:hypothetical protein
MGASLEKSIYVFRDLYLSLPNHQRNPSSESTTNFRASPCLLSAFYIVTIIGAVALEVVR